MQAPFMIDRLIPRELQQSAEQDVLLRARALIGAVLMVSGLVLTMLVVDLWHLDSDPQFVATMLPAFLMLLGMGGLSLFLFYRYASFAVSTHLFTTMHTVAQVWIILSTGGVQASPMTSMLALQPILAFLMAGRWAGLTWTIIVIALGIVLTPVDGADLVPQFKPVMREFLRQVVWIILCAVFFACFWYFDLINRRLSAGIGRERDLAEFAAAHDPLTDLLNRGAFERRLDTAVRRAQFSAQPLALIYIDLDGFKAINDSLGHHAGDRLLMHLAQQLRQTVRSTDSVARLGGDEFGLLLEGATRGALERLLPDIAQAMSVPMAYEGRDIILSASIGAALLPSDAGDPELLSRCADLAMYSAKANGRNRFAFYGDIVN